MEYLEGFDSQWYHALFAAFAEDFDKAAVQVCVSQLESKCLIARSIPSQNSTSMTRFRLLSNVFLPIESTTPRLVGGPMTGLTLLAGPSCLMPSSGFSYPSNPHNQVIEKSPACPNPAIDSLIGYVVFQRKDIPWDNTF